MIKGILELIAVDNVHWIEINVNTTELLQSTLEAINNEAELIDGETLFRLGEVRIKVCLDYEMENVFQIKIN
jgi:hypothetical protein